MMVQLASGGRVTGGLRDLHCRGAVQEGDRPQLPARPCTKPLSELSVESQKMDFSSPPLSPAPRPSLCLGLSGTSFILPWLQAAPLRTQPCDWDLSHSEAGHISNGVGLME